MTFWRVLRDRLTELVRLRALAPHSRTEHAPGALRISLPARLNGYRVSLECRYALEIIDACGRFRAGGRAGRAGPRRSS